MLNEAASREAYGAFAFMGCRLPPAAITDRRVPLLGLGEPGPKHGHP